MKQLMHFIFVAILVAVLTVVVGFALDGAQLMPPAAAKQAVPIDNLFRMHLWAIAFLFSLIAGFMLYSIVVFRRKKGETGEGDHFEGNTPLEIVWTVVPLIVVVYFAFLGADALAKVQAVDPEAMRVNVIGSQWSWKFEYPDLDLVTTELGLPINKQVLLKMSSTDVIHSFWVPEFRVKQDLLPGDLVRELRITPTELGDYKIRCAELCGTNHALMRAGVRVLTQADFETWVITSDPSKSDDPVVRGEAWANQFACLSCHSTDGSKLVGPSWAGVYGSQEALDDGSMVTVDDAYILESVLDPNAKIVEGFTANVMNPAVFEGITEAQIADIIEFIKTLK